MSTLARNLCVGAVTIGLTLGASLGASAAEIQLNLGGSTTTSSFYPYYTAIANSISESDPDINVTVLSTGGFAKNAALLKKGDLVFAGISPDLIADLEEDGFDKVRVLWWSLPAMQLVTVRKDARIESFSELNGKCFHPGMTGSSQEKNMIKVIRALGYTPKLYLSDSKDAVNAIKNGRCLGRQKAVGSPKLDAGSEELNLTTPLWPIGWTEEERAAIKKGIPWMDFVKMPAGIVDGSPEFWAHAIWIGFVASADVSEDTAYKLTKGMWSGIDKQRKALSGIRNREILKQTLEVSAYPLHAGAVRFYREQGLDVPERLLPPEVN